MGAQLVLTDFAPLPTSPNDNRTGRPCEARYAGQANDLPDSHVVRVGSISHGHHDPLRRSRGKHRNW